MMRRMRVRFFNDVRPVLIFFFFKYDEYHALYIVQIIYGTELLFLRKTFFIKSLLSEMFLGRLGG